MTNGQVITAQVVRQSYDTIRLAREDLGQDLSGFSPVDLLLDNIPSLDLSSARKLVEFVEHNRNEVCPCINCAWMRHSVEGFNE